MANSPQTLDNTLSTIAPLSPAWSPRPSTQTMPQGTPQPKAANPKGGTELDVRLRGHGGKR